MYTILGAMNCFVTHVQKNGSLLEVWLQKEHGGALALEKELNSLKSELRYAGNIPRSMDDLKHGLICCSKADDGDFYRAQIQHPDRCPPNAIQVHFIDYGRTDLVGLGDIRLFAGEEYPALARTPGLATRYFLGGITLGPTWNDNNTLWARERVQFKDYPCTFYSDGAVTLVSVQLEDSLFEDLLSNLKLANRIPIEETFALIKNMMGIAFPPPARLANRYIA